jgi:hypothetical protein
MAKKLHEKHEKLLEKANEISKRLAETIKDALKDEINTPEGRKKWLKGKKILFACCFCTKGMEKPEKETAINIMNTKQIYFCHKKCLLNKMTKRCRDEFQG